jgi:hypothetical protein
MMRHHHREIGAIDDEYSLMVKFWPTNASKKK